MFWANPFGGWLFLFYKDKSYSEKRIDDIFYFFILKR
jgi:hypothetical protein